MQELKEEFKVKVNVAVTAEKLRAMCRKHGEKAVDFLFRINKEREQAGMDFDALQYYMVRGINADVSTQTAIQKTKNWAELREHLQSYDSSVAANYERPKPEQTRTLLPSVTAGARATKPSVQPAISKSTDRATANRPPLVRKCFGCDETGHFARECPKKNCFGCGQPGHRAANCPVKFEQA